MSSSPPLKASQVIVLGTNVHSPRLIPFLAPLLNAHPAIQHWTLDHEDIDKVLRIEARSALTESEVMQTLASGGFKGIPLPD